MGDKLWDFECDTCGKSEELFASVAELPCSGGPICQGMMRRQLGGHPAASAPGRERRQTQGPVRGVAVVIVPILTARGDA